MAVPLIKTALPGPKAKAIIDRDRAVVSPSYTRGYPFVMAHGSGAVVEDVDGNVFLDCTAGIAVTATGHSHPDVVRAVTDHAFRMAKLMPTPVTEATVMMTAIGMVRAGIGITLLPASAAADSRPGLPAAK